MRERERQRKGAGERERARQGEVRDDAARRGTPYCGAHYPYAMFRYPLSNEVSNYIQRGTHYPTISNEVPNEGCPNKS